MSYHLLVEAKMETTTLNYITSKPILVDECISKIKKTSSGAMVIFTGLVRNHTKTKAKEIKEVNALEYTAFEPLANQLIQTIIVDAKKKFQLTDIFVLHRIGFLNLEDIAVIVITTSAHRKECYLGNQYIIDRIKHEVPIWKKEYFIDGTVEWSEGSIYERPNP